MISRGRSESGLGLLMMRRENEPDVKEVERDQSVDASHQLLPAAFDTIIH